MGAVHHANYLTWFEIGRMQFGGSLDLKYAAIEKGQIVSPVINVRVSYIKPIQYSEKVYMETWLKAYNGLRILCGYTFRNEWGET
ncbi:acyl-CoA thioesterase [Virgibacillus halophilus]|uniref:Hotdog domain-containing protein n=1 Tax=Tigheibacillus halophilus TaxID=361280 RepID=A0ABU5CAW7_9BACI|nr:hotdog domain-containing protein [Virgibacillus halophilus]